MITLIVNPIAGGVARAAGRLARAHAALAVQPEASEVRATDRAGHARDLATAAVAAGARLVIAWGGDGTVNEVASALVGTDVALGIVPAGSGNGLARELGVSPVPERAIAEAAAAASRPIDAGLLGGRWFFSVAGVGFDAHIAACFDRDLTGRRGLAGYARIAARELLAYRSRTYRVMLGPIVGSQHDENAAARGTEHRAFLITLANSGQWGNGARIAPGARLDDGKLDLVVFEERSRAATLFALPRVFTGTVDRVRGISIRRVESVVIESDTPMTFHVDGEVVEGGRRLEGRVHPGALSVAVR